MMGLTRIRLYGAIGAAVVVALFLGWAWRIDSLRAHYKRDYAACQANFAQFQADVKAKTELARISDAAHKAEVERDQNKVTMESDNEIRRRIAAAVAAVHNRVQPAAKTDSGSRGGQTVSSPSNATSGASGTSTAPVVQPADLEICAENTEKAAGWQSWWKSIAAIPR